MTSVVALEEEGRMVVFHLPNTDQYLCLVDTPLTTTINEHFEWVAMTHDEATANPDCVFIVTHVSTEGCYLQLASTGDYLQLDKQHKVDKRRYVATLASDTTLTARLCILPEPDSQVRLVCASRHHLAALEVDGRIILGARVVTKDAKGLFVCRIVEGDTFAS
jgi:hypothetical protein